MTWWNPIRAWIEGRNRISDLERQLSTLQQRTMELQGKNEALKEQLEKWVGEAIEEGQAVANWLALSRGMRPIFAGVPIPELPAPTEPAKDPTQVLPSRPHARAVAQAKTDEFLKQLEAAYQMAAPQPVTTEDPAAPSEA